MRSDTARDSDGGMAGPVICCNVETYQSVGRIDRFRWAHSTKIRQIAVVRPVMKTTTTTTNSISSSSATTIGASQSGIIISTTSDLSNDRLQSISTTTISGSSASSTSSSRSSSLPTPSSTSSSSSSQFNDGVSDIPIGWEHTWSFYYPNLTMSEAKQLLRPHPEGTFLLRNSSEPRYAYSLSVKTNRGTTSVRIQQMPSSGRYRLDCDPTQETVIPTFRSVPELIRHYLERNAEERNGTGCGRGHRYVFLESTGRMDTPVLILRPLLKDSSSLERLRNITAS